MMGDPFPEEVWDLILDKLEDPREAWNVFKAFPHLDLNATLQKKKRVWLFGLVIPHLLQRKRGSWIEGKDLLNCRLVCKQWSTSVDRFLEEQPQLRAYPPESVQRRSFNWNLKPYLDTEAYYFEFFGGIQFHTIDYERHGGPRGHKSAAQFIREMDSLPPRRNPFLSRSLDLYLTDNPYETEIVQAFANDIDTLLQRFGEQVWFFGFNFPLGGISATCMADVIRYLPNLRSIEVRTRECDTPDPDDEDDLGATLEPTDADVQAFVDAMMRNLPPLPYLESLKILNESGPNPLVHLLVTRFSAQIRRLQLDISFWKEEYSHLFPNLTEFDIFQWDGELWDEDTMTAIKKLLQSLDAPQLSKLELRYPYGTYGANVPLAVEEDLFRWLKRFPNMKFLDLGNQSKHLKTVEKGGLNPATDSHSSLQYLSIRTSFEMSYDFLRCLPSLQHLQLHVPSEPVVIDLSTNPPVRIKEQIQTGAMYQSNVWEVLPKLRTIVLEASRLSLQYVFTRRGLHKYERKIRDGSLLENKMVPLREDVVSFLSSEALIAKYRDKVEVAQVLEQSSSDTEEDNGSEIDEDEVDSEDCEGNEEDEEERVENESGDSTEDEEETEDENLN